MTQSKAISLSLTAAIVLAAAAAAYTVLGNASLGRSTPDPRQDSSYLPIPGPTATVPAPLYQDRDAALFYVEEREPGIARAIGAVEAENEAAIVESLRWEEFECTPDDHRGGIAPRCSDLGVPAGTSVPMFHYQLLSTSSFTEEQMRERIDKYLLGKGPRLGLIAAHPDGRWLITFTVDHRDDVDQPFGVDFLAKGDGQAAFVSHQDRYAAATPLDTLREEDREGELQWAIIYASPRLLDWEAEKDAMHRQQ